MILLLLVQLIDLISMRLAVKDHEESRLKSELTAASDIFQTIFSSSRNTLDIFNQTSNRILGENFTDDPRSLSSVLKNFSARVDADLAVAITENGQIKSQLVKNNKNKYVKGKHQGKIIPELLTSLKTSDDFLFYTIEDQIFQFSLSEVLVFNEPIGWVGFGYSIDNRLAEKFYKLNGFHISFITTNSEQCLIFASSYNYASEGTNPEKQRQCSIFPEEYEQSDPVVLGKIGNSEISAILYGSRDDILLSIQQRWFSLSVLAGLTLILSFLGAYLLAASISRPVLQLVKQAKYIAQGHYDKSVRIDDNSELGQLAEEFNLMQAAVLERENELLHNSSHDSLTNLPNRNIVILTMEGWIEDNVKHAIFLVKINHISEINESFGHEIADQMIKVVSERLETINNVSLLSHLRTDEFVLLVDESSEISVARWICEITEVLNIPFSTKEMNLHLQTNIGVVLSNGNNETPSNLLRMADSALKMSRQHKQLFKLYDKSLDDAQAERLSMMNDLHTAISDNQFVLFYQPKLSLASGKITHVEALIRWFHPEKGMIPPDKFIPIAENTGQIDQITFWVLEEAAKQHAIWKQQNIDITIAVNISAHNLKTEKIYKSLMLILDQYNLDMKALQLEVTESAVVEDPETAIAILSKFKDAGIMLSIDDYGTGYSSLAQLKVLPVHELKIDMSFIRKLPDDKADKIIVKSTIELAHSMGLSVVAEGVETDRALQWLDQNGCDLIQGYFISRPLPNDELLAFLNQSSYF